MNIKLLQAITNGNRRYNAYAYVYIAFHLEPVEDVIHITFVNQSDYRYISLTSIQAISKDNNYKHLKPYPS